MNDIENRCRAAPIFAAHGAYASAARVSLPYVQHFAFVKASAMDLLAALARSMQRLIAFVFGVRGPTKVVRRTVLPVIVAVRDFMLRCRLWAVEGFTNENVDRRFDDAPVVTQSNVGIAVFVNPRPNVAAHSRPLSGDVAAYGSDFGNLIFWRAANNFPFHKCQNTFSVEKGKA